MTSSQSFEKKIAEPGDARPVLAGISQYAALVACLIWGHFRRHRLEAVLCLIGVALGVAVVVAIDSAVAACVASFGGAVHSLAERSTHSIFAVTGSITDEQYIQLVRKKLPFALAPMVDRGVLARRDVTKSDAAPADPTRGAPTPKISTPSLTTSSMPTRDKTDDGNSVDTFARLIGVDVFAERSLRSFTQMQSTLDETAFRRFITEPDSVVLVKSLADELHVSVGSKLLLGVGGRRVEVTVVGVVVPTGPAASELSEVMIADLATAQEFTDTVGRLDRIDTLLDTDAQVAELTAALPAGLVLRSTTQQANALGQLIQAYRLNLNALSLMASFVAVFIVYNSMLISVQQRATSLGILRCLGSSRWQLASVYVTEAVGFAVLGGVLGVLGGWGLSRLLVGFIATTINDLYAVVRPPPIGLDSTMWLKGIGVATASCLVGALVPLWRASRTPPVNAFRGADVQRSSARVSVAMMTLGTALLGLAYATWWVPGDSPLAGFVMALLVAVGFALACPGITRAMCAVVTFVARPMQLLPLQMASAGVTRSLGITGVAVAATMLSMSMNIGIRTMVSSFRTSLDDWMGRRFAADIYIGPELLLMHKVDATLDPAVVQWVRRQPEVRHVGEYRSVDSPIGGKPTMVSGSDVAEVIKSLPMKSVASAGATFDPQHDALVSEPLAGRIKARSGDILEVSTPSGPRRFHVFGIFYDFGTERGQLMLERRTFAGAWADDRVSSLQISLQPGQDRRQLAKKWARELREIYPVSVDSFDGIHTQAMTIFDRTFQVTVVLTWLSGGVAFCGLAGSLLALALARRRDYSLLAAVGMSGRQLTAWVLAQGALIALASALVAPVAGTILAYVLAYVIQYRSFGWSIPTTPQPRFWIENLALATGAAVVAAVYPILRLRAAPPAASLRLE